MTSTHSPQERQRKARMKKAHTHTHTNTISRGQQLNTKSFNKIFCNMNHQTVLPEKIRETKLIPFRSQGGEDSLFGDQCPSLQSTLLLSTLPNDLKCHKEKKMLKINLATGKFNFKFVINTKFQSSFSLNALLFQIFVEDLQDFRSQIEWV